MISFPVTFDSTDGVETWTERGGGFGARIKFGKVIAVQQIDANSGAGPIDPPSR
jgi:hypothetical protein